MVTTDIKIAVNSCKKQKYRIIIPVPDDGTYEVTLEYGGFPENGIKPIEIKLPVRSKTGEYLLEFESAPAIFHYHVKLKENGVLIDEQLLNFTIQKQEITQDQRKLCIFHNNIEKYDMFQSLSLDKDVIIDKKELTDIIRKSFNFLPEYTGIMVFAMPGFANASWAYLREFIETGGNAVIVLRQGIDFNEALMRNFKISVLKQALFELKKSDDYNLFTIPAEKLLQGFGGNITIKGNKPTDVFGMNAYFKLSPQVTIINSCTMEKNGQEHIVAFQAKYGQGKVWFLNEFSNPANSFDNDPGMFTDNNINLANNLENAGRILDWLMK